MSKTKTSSSTQFEADQNVMIGMNDGHISRAAWNLIISIRDMKMFCNHGMVPHRHWRLKHVKDYFGLHGNKQRILAQLLEMEKQLSKK